jgi:hypothetical protein
MNKSAAIWVVTILAPCLGGVIGYLLGGPSVAVLGAGCALVPVVILHAGRWVEGRRDRSRDSMHDGNEDSGSGS